MVSLLSSETMVFDPSFDSPTILTPRRTSTPNLFNCFKAIPEAFSLKTGSKRLEPDTKVTFLLGYDSAISPASSMDTEPPPPITMVEAEAMDCWALLMEEVSVSVEGCFTGIPASVAAVVEPVAMTR